MKKKTSAIGFACFRNAPSIAFLGWASTAPMPLLCPRASTGRSVAARHAGIDSRKARSSRALVASRCSSTHDRGRQGPKRLEEMIRPRMPQGELDADDCHVRLSGPAVLVEHLLLLQRRTVVETDVGDDGDMGPASAASGCEADAQRLVLPAHDIRLRRARRAGRNPRRVAKPEEKWHR